MIRRTFLFMPLLLTFALKVYAQERPVRVGIDLGGNLCNYISDRSFYNNLYEWRLRFNASIFQDIRLTDRFFLQTEIGYSGLGTKTGLDIMDSAGNIAGTGSYKHQLHYLQLPVTFKIKFGKMIRGYVEMGPYLGILMVAKGEISPDFDAPYHFPTDNLIDAYKPVDIGLKIGGGIEIPLLPGHYLTGGIRYSQGVIDITKSPAMDFNSAFTFRIGYMFDL